MSNIVQDYSKRHNIKNDGKLYQYSEEISRNLSVSVNKIDMIPQEEKCFLLYEHNNTNVDFSKTS